MAAPGHLDEPSAPQSTGDDVYESEERVDEVTDSPSERGSTQMQFGMEPLPAPDLQGILARDAMARGASPAPSQPLGRENNDLAEWYRNRGPPGPIDEPENFRKGALVHAALTLLRLNRVGHEQGEKEMRQLFLGIWTNDQIGGMESYLTTSVDATPTDAELETFVAATQGEQGQWQAPDLEGGLVHAALTVVRLTGGGLHDAASAVRQQAALIWHDEDLQQVMNYVREHDGDPRKLEVRRYDRVMAGEQQAEGEEFQEDEDDGEFQAVENR